MADGIYVSMCGAAARAEQLEAVADNLSNAQTPGFKASRPAFESFMAAGAGQDKLYPAAVATGLDLRPGPTSRTGNALDVVPNGGAFLTVRTPKGAIAFTRDGRLTLDAARRLVSDGRTVLGQDGKPIDVPPDLVPEIEASGVIRAGGQEIGQLALARLEGPVDRVGPTLVAPGEGGRAVPVDAGVRTGELELGNSSALDAAIQLVTVQRAYDASMQAIQTYRQMDQRAVEVARVK